MTRVLVYSLCVIGLPTCAARADQRVTFKTDLNFYGDNTEFANPFRDGETLLGTSGRLFFDVTVNERVTVRGGVFGNHRFGSAREFELVRPVFALILKTDRARFVFGTLETVEREDGRGPDRTGPHGLLPPLQLETLAFTRPYEAGVQWTVDTTRLRHDVWLNWQRLNTAREREVFDAGYVSRMKVRPAVWLAWQWHLVHHGGQQFNAGPVSDSMVVGPGVVFRRRTKWLDAATLEAHGLASHHAPERDQPQKTTSALGIFMRMAGERAGWRGHLIVWRATCDFIKEEGDPNYLSIRRDGSRFKHTRDYAELGATRLYHPADEVQVEASARLHRVEDNYEYSYRVFATVRLSFPVR